MQFYFFWYLLPTHVIYYTLISYPLHTSSHVNICVSYIVCVWFSFFLQSGGWRWVWLRRGRTWRLWGGSRCIVVSPECNRTCLYIYSCLIDLWEITDIFIAQRRRDTVSFDWFEIFCCSLAIIKFSLFITGPNIVYKPWLCLSH